jgi:hypothetical protein
MFINDAISKIWKKTHWDLVISRVDRLVIEQLAYQKTLKSIDIPLLPLEFKKVFQMAIWHIHIHEDHWKKDKNEEGRRTWSKVD